MAVKVTCPACSHEMNLKSVKAGRFKPNCTHCKEPFLLVVSDTDPAQLRVTRIASTATVQASPQSGPQSGAAFAPVTPGIPAQDTAHAAQRHTPRVDNQATMEHSPSSTDSARVFQDSKIDSPTVPTLPAFSVDAAATLAATDSTVRPPSQRTTPLGDDELTLDSPAAMRTVGTAQSAAAATVQTTKQSVSPRVGRAIPVPERLGGYRIIKELGHGGMGAVYLANQLSLDRRVAVKTIQSDWAANPRVIARFIREAYAAAQLTHHNVVQIYDLGQDQNLNFFSMELVEGGSLDDLLKQKGRLPPNEAATYILHAARGLKFAHDHGMIHRDIKPANLMLTKDCLVKVADLGLVKTPFMAEDEQTRTDEDKNLLLASARSQVTGAGSTLGTPAYMSPEQAEDATTVDQRADIYSLGCTFYALLVGKPPYGSLSALEILSKIRTEPIERPDKVVSGIPSQLASIVEKMTAKAREDRYSSLDEVIPELEDYLASTVTSKVDLAKQRADALQNAAEQFAQAPAAKLRRLLPMLFTAACGLGLLLGLLVSFQLALMCFLILVLTPIFITLISSVTGGRSPIIGRVRTLVLGSSIGDWITWLLAGLLMLLAVWALGMLAYAIAGSVLAAAAAASYYWLVTRALTRQRQAALAATGEVLREMRLTGMTESAIGQFMAEFSGRDWEELFETVFDYDLLRQMRSELQSTGKLRGKKRFQAWRDFFVDRLDTRCTSIREERERRVLAKVEIASLKASGVSQRAAEQQASEIASSLVAAASETRALTVVSMSDTAGSAAEAAAKRERIKQMLASARSGKPKSITAKASLATSKLLSHVFGGKLRFAIGVMLLIGCLMWANQNNLFDKAKLSEVSKTVTDSATTITEGDKSFAAGQAVTEQVTQKFGQILSNTQPLAFPVVGPWFTSFAPGVMGVFILISAVWGSWRLTIPATAAAMITLLGPSLGVPALGFSQGAAWLSCGLATLVLCIPILVKPLR